MTPKRTVVVAVAVAVGVLASVLSYVFLNGAQQRAYHNAKLVPAYVVSKPIPRTLTWTDAVNGGYVQKKSVPAEFRPTAAVTSLTALQGKEADAPFSVGQVVVTSMFVSPIAAANTFSGIIPAGNVRELDEFPAEILSAVTFHPVKTMEEVLEFGLRRATAPAAVPAPPSSGRRLGSTGASHPLGHPHPNAPRGDPHGDVAPH